MSLSAMPPHLQQQQQQQSQLQQQQQQQMAAHHHHPHWGHHHPLHHQQQQQQHGPQPHGAHGHPQLVVGLTKYYRTMSVDNKPTTVIIGPSA